MKTNMIVTLAAVLTAITFNALAADAYLTPRAQGNQIKVVPGVAVVKTVLPSTVLLTPRAQGNQLTRVSGVELVLVKCPLLGTPRAIGAEGSEARTACCGQTVANCEFTTACSK